MYAVIETGGKQYQVKEGDEIFVDKLDVEGEFTFDKVMMLGKDDGAVVGAPYVEGAKVTCKVEKQGKDKKVRVFKYKAKKGSTRARQGHRQPYTKLTVVSIEG